MESLSQPTLKSQTVIGCVRALFCFVSWPVVIEKLDDFLDKDSRVFNCVPKPSDVIRQLCYDSYVSTTSQLKVTTKYFSVIMLSVLGFLWVFIIFYGATAVRQIKGEHDREKKKVSIGWFWRICLSHVGFEALFVIAMMVLFCCKQTLSLPKKYRCSQQNVTTHTQMVNVTCNDQFIRDKTQLNFAIVGIMAAYICLCIATMVFLLFKKKNFLDQLVVWESSICDTPSDQVSLGQFEIVMVYCYLYNMLNQVNEPP